MSCANLALQELLQKELSERKTRNPAYSLRAFARMLRMSPSAVSEILRGQRTLSVTKILLVTQILGVAPDQTQAILEAHPRRMKKGKLAQRVVATIDVDKYQSIAQWQHFAILSLMETEDFRCDSTWMAERLGIAKAELERSVERLARLGMLDGSLEAQDLRATGTSYTSTDEVTNLSLRKAHFQNLALAERSLELDEISERDFTSITMAIDPQDLPEAKRRIRRFRDELCSFLEAGKKKQVYKFNMNMIPLSKGNPT